jgi:hypothetical protein
MVLPVLNPGRATETESLRIVEARILAVGGMSRLATAEVAGWNRFPSRLGANNSMNHASCSITPFKMRDAMLQEGHCFRENTPDGLWRRACILTWFSKAASSLAILAMAAASAGVSVVREMAVEKRDGCRFLPLADESATRRVGIVQLK